ncbi:MAG TPA: 50S ribosomal protein L32 [Oceanospirillales bacterium]|nr:50S ribosomal protein L32 [Oceanospirillales bacterium]
MAHPKSKISKQRKRKRRTHIKAAIPQIATCPTTGEPHIYHRSYWLDGNMYYKGQIVIRADEDLD